MIQSASSLRERVRRSGSWMLIVLLLGACATGSAGRDRSASNIRHWLQQAGPLLTGEPLALQRLRPYVGSITGTAAALEQLFRYADPDTQPVARMLAARNLLLLTDVDDWRDNWLPWGVRSLQVVDDPGLRSRLRGPLLDHPRWLSADDWALWMLQIADRPVEEQKQFLQNWTTVEDDPELLQVMKRSIDEPEEVADRRAPAILLLPFSGQAASIGWRLGGDFVAGFADQNGLRSLVVADSENPLQAAGSLVGMQAWKPVVIGPFRKESVLQYASLIADLGFNQILFNPVLEGVAGQRFAIDPAHVAADLFDQLYQQVGARRFALFVPASGYGDAFMRAFTHQAAAVTDAIVTGAAWYREDLSDLAVQARELYGVDRYPRLWLAEQNIDPATVDGIVQHDVCVVAGNPGSLARIIRELEFYGSTLQAWAGDFGWNNDQLAQALNVNAPVLFMDHFGRGITGAGPDYERFKTSTRQFNRGQNTLPDLLFFEAGQYSALRLDRTGKGDYALAGGLLKVSENGLMEVPVYPLMVSGTTVRAANMDLIRTGVLRQSARYRAFQEVRQRVEEEKKEAEKARLKERDNEEKLRR